MSFVLVFLIPVAILARDAPSIETTAVTPNDAEVGQVVTPGSVLTASAKDVSAVAPQAASNQTRDQGPGTGIGDTTFAEPSSVQEVGSVVGLGTERKSSVRRRPTKSAAPLSAHTEHNPATPPNAHQPTKPELPTQSQTELTAQPQAESAAPEPELTIQPQVELTTPRESATQPQAESAVPEPELTTQPQVELTTQPQVGLTTKPQANLATQPQAELTTPSESATQPQPESTGTNSETKSNPTAGNAPTVEESSIATNSVVGEDTERARMGGRSWERKGKREGTRKRKDKSATITTQLPPEHQPEFTPEATRLEPSPPSSSLPVVEQKDTPTATNPNLLQKTETPDNNSEQGTGGVVRFLVAVFGAAVGVVLVGMAGLGIIRSRQRQSQQLDPRELVPPMQDVMGDEPDDFSAIAQDDLGEC